MRWVESGLLWRGLEISFAFFFTLVNTVDSVMKMGILFLKKKKEDYSSLESYLHMFLRPLAQLISSIYSRITYEERALTVAAEKSGRLAVFVAFTSQ